MRNWQKLAVFLTAVAAGAALAFTVPNVVPLTHGAAIKVWTSNERLTSADLNANFAHIHNLMVGGHGGRLLDADVSGSASIASSKLADGTGIAKAWVMVNTTCSASPCTILASKGVTSVTRSGAGTYTVNLNFTATDTSYAVGCTTALSTVPLCTAAPGSTSSFTIGTQTTGAVATDGRFMAVLYDNN